VCLLITGLTFVLGRTRVARNMAQSGSGMRNATPRKVAFYGGLMLAAIPIVWFILLTGP
jgi:hypothetical protein